MKRGFTLIELLVVIAIIGILTSVVIQAVNDKKAKNKQPQKSTQAVSPSVTQEEPDPKVVEDDRKVNSCIESISSERERAQERFQKEMDYLDEKISRQCFNNYSR